MLSPSSARRHTAVAFKKNACVLKKLSKLSHEKRKSHLNKWDVDAFKDIKKISKLICTCKRIPKKTLTVLQPHKKTIRRIANSQPVMVKKILTNQRGGFLFALAGTLLPIIIDQIVKAVKK